MSRLRDDTERVMHPERSSPSKRPPRRGRRWLAVGGAAPAAIVSGGTLGVVLSGRDDARPLAVEASPTPTATVQTPSPTASPSASPSPSATLTQTPEPTATPPPTSDTDAWIGPELISTRAYGALSLVVDSDGIAHAASSLDGSIYYLTNATGSWTREPVSNRGPGGPDFAPMIALDDGSLWIAFSRGYDTDFGVFPLSIAYVTNRSGDWSDPVTVAEDGAHSPSLVVRQGRIHLAYVAGHGGDVACGDEFPVHYATDVTGAWSHERVARHGYSPTLTLASDRRAHILIEDACGFLGAEGLWYATTDPATGSFSVEGIPGSLPPRSAQRAVALELDASNRPHAAFWQYPHDEIADSYYTARGDDGWGQPEVVLTGATAQSMVIDDHGAGHIIGIGESGVWYASNRRGAFQAHQLLAAPSAMWASHGAIAVDAAGRPHILVVVAESDESGEVQSFELWYAMGPGD
jgi:hypothetical protein